MAVWRIHIGRSVPQKLRAQGWQEVGGLSIHLGRGIWLFRLEYAPARSFGASAVMQGKRLRAVVTVTHCR